MAGRDLGSLMLWHSRKDEVTHDVQIQLLFRGTGCTVSKKSDAGSSGVSFHAVWGHGAGGGEPAPGGWEPLAFGVPGAGGGLSPASCFPPQRVLPPSGDRAEAGAGDGCEVGPLPSPVGGSETTMYFWTLPGPEGAVLGGAEVAVETSLTMGCTLGTVVVTGDVVVEPEPGAEVLRDRTWEAGQAEPTALHPYRGK